MSRPLRIWIDLSNSPHPLLFGSLARRLEEHGHSVLVTARDHAQTVELARRWWPDVDVVGGESPEGRGGKASALARRVRALARWGGPRRPDVALSHNSYAQIVAARVLGIPAVTAMDFEHQPANHLAFRAANRILLPDALRSVNVARQGATRSKTVFYPGLKEELYIGDFDPDPDILRSLGIVRAPGEILAVSRTPPARAIYHRFPNPLFAEALLALDRDPRVHLVVLVRHPEERQAVAELELRNCVVPAGAIDARSLMYVSDLVLGAGGTMTREAALLGVPTLSLFGGRQPAVDRWLEERGRLGRLASAAGLAAVTPRAVEPQPLDVLRSRSAELSGTFVSTIESTARRRDPNANDAGAAVTDETSVTR